MGAMDWQVVQVNRKNSTKTGRPVPVLTEAGALASSLSPREVASAIGWSVSVGRASLKTIGVAKAATVGAEVTAGLQAASNQTANQNHPNIFMANFIKASKPKWKINTVIFMIFIYNIDKPKRD
jgi:hypothetical protein